MINPEESGSEPQRSRMVTKRLDNKLTTGRERFPEHTVVGVYSDNQKYFVRHVAMLARNVEFPTDIEVQVWHMGPPLVADEESETTPKANLTTRVDIVSDISLSIPELNSMKNWRANVNKQRRPRLPFQQYIVKPHMKWERSEKGRKLYQRFSCSGFVLECYKEAEITLIDGDATLPEIDEQVLSVAYPDLVGIENMKPALQARLGFKGREDLGLEGNGPWQIVLPGYLFHSLQRASADKPRPDPHVPTSISEAHYS